MGPYIQKMVDALEPLFALPLLLGLWSGRALLRRWDQAVMVAFCGLCLAAVAGFWYLVHDIQGRYFFPIVLVSVGYAALGALQWAELLQHAVVRMFPAHQPRLAWSLFGVLVAIA